MMRLRLLISFLCLLVFASLAADGQTNRKPVPTPEPSVGNSTATAAFAEIALKRTEFEADLEALLVDYTDDFPRVKELRFALTKVEAESERLKALKAADHDRATSALGKLMVRKVEAEIELWKLQQSYADGHPEVRRAKKRVEIFEKAIKEILG
jgi:hypothetical protein